MDPVYEIVGLYYSTILGEYAPGVRRWCTDLFAAAVMAGVTN